MLKRTLVATLAVASAVTFAAAEEHITVTEDTVVFSEVAETEMVALAEASLDQELIAKGAKVFKKCKSCHKVGEGAKNGAGPLLTGVVYNPAGAVDGFKYSKALNGAAKEGLVWTPEELASFLTKPKEYLKKTKMSFSGLKKEDDRSAVIEYLKSYE